jgi:topoisomerase-4 subunit A
MTKKNTSNDSKAGTLKIVRSGDNNGVSDVSLEDHTEFCLKVYGEEVNLDRAVVDLRDGLKPVSRRLLWALYTMRSDKMVKTARLSGETIGKYHPHGSQSVDGAITTQVTTETPPVTGVGNWGSIIDPPGAPRYTNVMMSLYGETFFHKHYLPLVPMVDTYDGKGKEPLFLPSLLPNIFLNGATGIGLGMATAYPSFKPFGILSTLADLADGNNLSNQQIAARVELYHKYGGEPITGSDFKKNMVRLLEEPKSSFKFRSPLEINRDSKEVTISRFGPEIDPVKLVENWIKLQPEVQTVYSGRGVSYTIRCNRNINFNEFDAFVEKLNTRVTTSQSYDLYVTQRIIRKENPSKYDVRFARMGLRRILDSWLKYRINLERRSLEYRISLSEKQIAYYDLLILACSKLDAVFKALRSQDPRSTLMKELRITEEQADTILNLKVRQLSKLDNETIEGQKAEESKSLASLRKKLKNPAALVAEFLRDHASRFKLVKNDWSTQWQL